VPLGIFYESAKHYFRKRSRYPYLLLIVYIFGRARYKHFNELSF